MHAQISFDFFDSDQPALDKCESSAAPGKPHNKAQIEAADRAKQEAYWAQQRAEDLDEAREHWKVGMATSLPCWARVLESSQTYTQMLPGVIESIADDKASVRIYAAPEYGCWLEDYPLHRKLAVDVSIVELGKYMVGEELERIVAEGRLEAGDPKLAARVRERHNSRRAA